MTRPAIERPVAVVTGASSGFGEAIVHKLADRGWLTVGVARREDRLCDLAYGVTGDFEPCDLTDQEQILTAADAILDRHPRINLLVNNAGMALRGRPDEVRVEEAATASATNFVGPFAMTDALLSGLKTAAPSADIVNVVSAAAHITNPGSAVYGASKSAQGRLSSAMTASLRPDGIRVHAIHPGKADTEGHPQEPSNSPISRLTRTDIDAVAQAVINRIGQRPREIYVPGFLKVIAVANAIAPVTTTRLVDWVIS